MRAPPRPIRACARCCRVFRARRSSRSAGLPPRHRNPILTSTTAVTIRPTVPTATISRANFPRTATMVDIFGMMKQAQQLQSKMQEMQDQLANVEVEGISGGGLVPVRMTRERDVKGVKSDPALSRAKEGEGLEDLLVPAFGGPRRKAEAAMQEKMQSLT